MDLKAHLKSLAHTADGTLRAPWRLLVFAVASTLLGAVPALLVRPFTESPRIDFLSDATVSSVIGVVAIICGTWAALRLQDKKPWSDVGLDPTAARPAMFGIGFLVGGAAIGLTIGFLILVGWLRPIHVIGSVPGHPLIRVTALLLPAALGEELMTRGYPLTVLRDAWGWTWAVVVTSIAFGLLHLGNPGVDLQSVVLVILAGVFLAMVRIATGSLYAAWAAHFAWNWVMAVVFHAPVSGLAFDAPSYRYVDSGPDWATGGAWGPEGGIPAGLAMVVGTGLLLLWRRRRGKEQIGGPIDV